MNHVAWDKRRGTGGNDGGPARRGRSRTLPACRLSQHAGSKLQRPRRAFTLFEVILAVALAAVLVGLLGMALHVYMQSVSSGRGDVEQAQLARAVLSRIADDLRAAIRETKQDVSSLANVAQSTGVAGSGSGGGSAGGGGAGGGSGSGGGSGAGGSGSGPGGASAGGSGGSGGPSANQDLASNAAPPPAAGLYGNQFELQVDISRMPRFDELDALLQTNLIPAGHASDVRTVAYYLQQGSYADESSAAATGMADQAATLRSGLMRRELDRATALFAAESGGAQLLTQGATLLAPEVTWIEFQYFDGTQLWTEWDSTARGGPPVAVEVRVWLRPHRRQGDDAEIPPGGTTQTGPGEADAAYRMVVHLPAAEPSTSADATSTPAGTGDTSGGSGGTSGTGSGTGGGQR